MERGIQYAKDEKRIENVSITKGQIFCTVQGTAPTPYRVKLNLKIIPEEIWSSIIKDLGKKTINLVRLLEGALPEDISSIFDDFKYPLFPEFSEEELTASCSCPDKEDLCKHIGATILYVARILDYDPFLLLELRGKTKTEILSQLSLTTTLDSKLESKQNEKNTEMVKAKEYSFDVPEMSISTLSKDQQLPETLDKIGFQIKSPGKVIETLEGLGLPLNLENSKSFAAVLEGIYRAVTHEIYDISMELEKN